MSAEPPDVDPAGASQTTVLAMPPGTHPLVGAAGRVGVRLPAPRNIGLVAAGGAIGTAARVAVGVALPTAEGGWPWATMTANVSGALLLGLVLGAARDAAVVGRWVRPLVGTGIIGGYTTLSTLSVETLQLTAGGRLSTAVAYAVASAAGGLAAVWLGLVGTRLLRRVRWGGR